MPVNSVNTLYCRVKEKWSQVRIVGEEEEEEEEEKERKTRIRGRSRSKRIESREKKKPPCHLIWRREEDFSQRVRQGETKKILGREKAILSHLER